jgi:hypothetical protein
VYRCVFSVGNFHFLDHEIFVPLLISGWTASLFRRSVRKAASLLDFRTFLETEGKIFDNCRNVNLEVEKR